LLKELGDQLNEQLGCLFGIVGTKGTILMCSDSSQEGKEFARFNELTDNTKDKVAIDRLIFTKIKVIRNVQYYVFVEDLGSNTDLLLNLLALYVRNYLKNNVEKIDKDFFLKQILQGDIDEAEIEKRNRIFKLGFTEKKALLNIRMAGVAEYPLGDILKNLFSDIKDTGIIELDNKDTVLLITAKDNMEETALSIIATVEEQLMIPTRVSIGKTIGTINELRASYISSLKAYDIGAIYEEGRSVYDYNKMGTARLFHDIPVERLEEFINETITSEVFDQIDDETIKTMQSFFENNLNISETARKMYLHRNTLVYRIDKLMKLTGMNVTNFDSAVLFHTICQIKCYLRNMGRK
jgi:carbohydrate diacid regulator